MFEYDIDNIVLVFGKNGCSFGYNLETIVFLVDPYY